MMISLLIAYLIGSIPFGLLLTKIFVKKDLREIGSGNIGATNVLRTGHKGLALATLLLDAAKGVAAILLLGGNLYVGLAAIIGHCFPVWLKFKGGKGVATTFGVLVIALPWVAFVAASTWGMMLGFFRISSLAALSAAAIVPLAALLLYGAVPALITLLIAALVIWRHKENIQRLLAGTEPKIGDKKEKD